MWQSRHRRLQAAAQSGGVAPVAPPQREDKTLVDRLHRVTPDDLANVSEADVQKALARSSQADLILAMRVMLEERRFAEVLACSSPSTWRCAARGVRPEPVRALNAMLRERWGLLQSILPHVSEEFLSYMQEYFPAL